MKSFNLTILLLIFVLMIFVFSSKGFSQERLVIGAYEFPPYASEEFKDNGFLCKLISESFAMEGIQVDYKFQPAKRTLSRLEHGKLDGVIGNYQASEFENKFYTSDSLVIDTISFFYLISSEFEWNTFDDLKEITVGGTLGYDYGQPFYQAEASNVFQVDRAPGNLQNFGKLLKMRIHAFPMSTLPGYVLLYKNFKAEDISRITNHSKPVHSTHLYLLLSKTNKKNQRLIEIFNRSLKQLREQGKYDQYFDETLEFFRETYVNK